jgi:run domain Beclin-1 interacting cysteine-rich containing protein
MASLYSEADLAKHPLPRTGTDVALTETVVSAEGVALSLLRQFSEKHLPRASELEWLVSEQDAPQQVSLLCILMFSNYMCNC